MQRIKNAAGQVIYLGIAALGAIIALGLRAWWQVEHWQRGRR